MVISVSRLHWLVNRGVLLLSVLSFFCDFLELKRRMRFENREELEELDLCDYGEWKKHDLENLYNFHG